MTPSKKWTLLASALFLLGISGAVAAYSGRRHVRHLLATGSWPVFRSVEETLELHEPGARARLKAGFRSAGLSWPPKELLLVAFKEERVLEMWCRGDAPGLKLVKTYPILAASGKAGPKERRGDQQVPEGFYDLTELNPNSLYHLSIRIGYPNGDDLRRSTVTPAEMGDDIFLHGGDKSIGCIAVGDPAVEEIFTVAALAGPGRRKIIISPADLRTAGTVLPEAPSEKISELWVKIAAGLPR